MEKDIIIKGAREHNLKNIDVKIPREKLVVLTGLSGSGKSSLAFDTIYAEGQRRYVESLSSYARMFLGQMEKPDVDYIDGLSPAISIDQKTTSKNPRSTVGTVTEIYDYLRLLYARIGIPHCPKCGKEVQRQSIDQIVDKVMSLGEGTKIQILAPVIRGKKGEHKKVFENARKSGYVRVKADGEQYDLSEPIELKKTQKHNIEIIIDRLIIRENIVQRLTDSLETAIALTGDVVLVEVIGGEIMSFSQNFACDDCGISLQELVVPVISFKNLRSTSKKYVEVSNAELKLLSESRKVSNLLFSLDFYQRQPVGEKIQPCTYYIYMTDDEGVVISDRQTVIADRTSTNASERVFRVRLNLKAGAYDKNKIYRLVIANDTDVPEEAEFHIDIAFADDFGFDL